MKIIKGLCFGSLETGIWFFGGLLEELKVVEGKEWVVQKLLSPLLNVSGLTRKRMC